ncbi:GTPase-activating Rap/Ran-GAP domain-like protein 3 isoform X1 [Tribolium castaneum]|uniref:GTPase-activating Rap/Ran-GAP domain-like protein 3 n=1 Tax=Tribolium castaneum TaxID=7070 RepID=D6X4H2_TRICA|nr:PREDICTED: GTPase-activating Rap/Ran-GAP domain-like protein 3 isoform X1 [Tribolium castaneum]XP_015839585.1 PREDICTED: GTPase-activating Rap/Ran-GAP domain-like protein 3 isoform X1 [Tribolium castaneum]EEZ97268.2 GTPase-activating Rap/Ran-GAP domain-like protein 3 [Tribolium castaneum]|eukprot:XP_008198814.1 PREDICTED: GTPase-activating Rap/Ran-GAP domain-like protein 3 isoform X1 [Tribolium castaneum]
MLCLDMRLVQRLRGERTEDTSSRDRSKSVCVTSFRSKPPRDVSAFKLFHRRASSAISTASDLISRRGVFSRRYYGSVEQLQQPENDGQEHCRRFRIENGDSPGEKDEMFGSPSTPVLENPEYQTRWYFKYFLGKLHQNYVGLDNDKSPFFLSIVLNDDNNTCVPLYRAILFRKTGAQKISLPIAQNKVLTVKQILSNFPNMDRVDKGPKEIFSPDIQKDLLLLEEQEGSVNFKFGVIYMKHGQTTDDEILSNEFGSKRFDQFLALLGDKIRLKGWDKYRGGLDIKGDMTGKYSVYTIYEGHEIMFHVSTLLPYSRDNKQQVERKRHIGNDIVNIVFVDVDDPTQSENAHALFNPTCIKSQFTHVFAVVSVDRTNQYRLSVFSDEAVPLFGPSLPCPPVFKDPQLFRDFLLVKLINGEKATFETPTFARKRERTLDMLIKDLYSEHMTDARMTMLNRRAFSDVLAETPRHSRLKEDSRQIEFVRIGQALKLEAIVRGDAPTSLASAGSSGTVFKRSPWEASCFYPVFPPHPIVCADSWGDNRLVIGTEEGIFVVEDGSSHRQVFDRSLQVKQLNVVEPHGILLLRGGHSNKEGKIYVFRLSQIETLSEPKCRLDIKDHRLERTRGVHLYAISRPGGARLRMCVAIGRKLLMFQWKHSAAWTAWCPSSDTDTVEGFTFLWELNLNETPTMMTILDSGWSPNSPSPSDVLVCVGYKNHWDIVNGRSGYAQHLHTVESTKAHLVTALDLYEDQEIQLLLCYNHTCHFQKINEENSSSTEFDFHWNSVPTDIVCAFPYVIAFTSNSMEIRLIVNGNLVHTMSMPKLQLVASKNDIFFATTAPEFFPNRQDRLVVERQQEMQKISPPSSPNASPEVRPLRIYRIPIHALSRSANPEPGCHVSTESPPTWKSADAKLAVPEQPRVSRSATSSPIPAKAKLASIK